LKGIVKIFKLLLVLFLLCSLPIVLFSQQTRTLSKPFLEFKNNILVILYNFPDDCKAIYRVWVEIKDSKGKSIQPNSIYGDIGENISPGKNKRISWNLMQDSIYLNDALSVRVLAQQMPKQFSRTNLIISSALLPGLGQSKNTGKPYWLTGIAAYGCLAGSYWFNRKASDSYELYLYSEEREANDNYFNKTVFQNNTSKVLAYSSIALWTANMVWIAIMPANRSNENKRITVGLKPEVYNSGNTISFYLTLNLSQ